MQLRRRAANGLQVFRPLFIRKTAQPLDSERYLLSFTFRNVHNGDAVHICNYTSF
jgi:hypothetical protein